VGCKSTEQEKLDIRAFHHHTVEVLKRNERYIEEVASSLEEEKRDLLRSACRRTLLDIMGKILPESYVITPSMLEELSDSVTREASSFPAEVLQCNTEARRPPVRRVIRSLTNALSGMRRLRYSSSF